MVANPITEVYLLGHSSVFQFLHLVNESSSIIALIVMAIPPVLDSEIIMTEYSLASRLKKLGDNTDGKWVVNKGS